MAMPRPYGWLVVQHQTGDTLELSEDGTYLQSVNAVTVHTWRDALRLYRQDVRNFIWNNHGECNMHAVAKNAEHDATTT